MRPFIEFRSRDGLSLRERNPYFGIKQPHIIRRFLQSRISMAKMNIDGSFPDIAERNDEHREYELRDFQGDSCIYVEK